jgi:hypothetical protein
LNRLRDVSEEKIREFQEIRRAVRTDQVASFRQNERDAERREQEDFEELLCAGGFAANDIVSLDDCGDPNVRSVFVFSLIDANHAPVGANEDFCTACDFGGQCERKIQLRAWREVSLHPEIYAAR